jgi:hypothetical protein
LRLESSATIARTSAPAGVAAGAAAWAGGVWRGDERGQALGGGGREGLELDAHPHPLGLAGRLAVVHPHHLPVQQQRLGDAGGEELDVQLGAQRQELLAADEDAAGGEIAQVVAAELVDGGDLDHDHRILHPRALALFVHVFLPFGLEAPTSGLE